MSEDLFKALYSRFTGNPTDDFYTLTGGRLTYGRADDSWNTDYAVMYGPGVNPDDLFRCKVDDVDVQINLFSDERAKCWAILKACVDFYDGVRLTIDNHYPARMQRHLSVPPIWNEEDELWQATAEFGIKIQAV